MNTKHPFMKTAILCVLALGLTLFSAGVASAQRGRMLAFPTVNNPYGIDPATFNIMSASMGMGMMPSMNGSAAPPGISTLNTMNQQMTNQYYASMGLPPPGSISNTNMPSTSLAAGLKPGQILSQTGTPISNPNQVSINQIISLAKSKVSDSTIQQQLLSSGSTYNLSPSPDHPVEKWRSGRHHYQRHAAVKPERRQRPECRAGAGRRGEPDLPGESGRVE